MTKFLLRSTLFVLVLIVINLLYLKLVRTTDWNFAKRVESLELNDPQHDLLVIGNSLPMDGVDTEYLSRRGISSYNLSLGGATFRTSHLQLVEYLNRYDHKPAVVLLGGSTEIGNFDSDRISGVVEVTIEGNARDSWYVPMLKFKGMFFEMLKKIVSAPHREAYLIGGQLRFARVTPDETSFRDFQPFDLQIYQNSTQLSEIMETCKSHDIQLIVVEMPGFMKTRHRESWHSEALTKDGVVFLDCNTVEYCQIFDSERDWIGNNHLNSSGARKFTKSLLPLIQECCFGE